MSEFRRAPASRLDAAQTPQATLFVWRGGGVVVLGDYHDDRWVVSRGWLKADALTDVRRWTFAAPSAFAGQVRRLVLDATGDGALARANGADALDWATAASGQSAS